MSFITWNPSRIMILVTTHEMLEKGLEHPKPHHGLLLTN